MPANIQYHSICFVCKTIIANQDTDFYLIRHIKQNKKNTCSIDEAQLIFHKECFEQAAGEEYKESLSFKTEKKKLGDDMEDIKAYYNIP